MIIIEKSSQSSYIDFNDISFGKNYSDHMFYCKFNNGKWEDPIIKKFGEITVSPISLVFHYGQAIFEGMKAYKDKDGNVFLFRPFENFNRINSSAKRLEMPLIDKSIFIDGLKQLLYIDKNWIPNHYGQSIYIRPFLIASDGRLSANPSKKYIFMIICTTASNYYFTPLKVNIEQKYSRSTDGGIGFTKAAGNYASSFFPTRIAQEEGYDQILWTDSSTHSFIEESGTMNVFFYIKDSLITAPANKKILNGITRKSIITLAKEKGIRVKECNLSVSELIYNIRKNLVKEVFGCGTAVVLNFFKKIGYRCENFYLPKISSEKRISFFLKKRLLDIQHNVVDDPFGWRFKL
ncbi:branched-chain amino acid aminotransferase [Candidatus Karelsulcia muelleri]|uniref:branched-chain amino acid aminotransferase n=1 Tax=Candidatus Karelsulcia muelleri TaxID=336810 RepID=UPI0007F9DE34|nr:branched-chain amino acid aminotransferase [Candidatus Karelsulcia muelleri]ANO35721.1 branched-chain amino acid aminotransferase [Candidatus Karelsulcia muelleri]QSF25110.1 branched-chain amino acid aminotransferase [Candidatus Karelsulcia muelleri]WKD87332.1 branched-chain amino acid aminotransferase [Candidatus Karelsulcia muelleri]BEH03765.1 branched-chain-amino-acid aminotransferase [Candidatus Karelsulcia muelleri]